MLKLFYAPNSCALAPHIALNEARADFDLVKVDTMNGEQRSAEYLAVNPKAKVPSLATDRGILTEVAVILQYLSDQKPAAHLAPAAGTPERYRVLEWLNFITTELHKTLGPMFRPTTPEEFKTLSRDLAFRRFEWVDKQLAGKQYLMGNTFTLPDAYLYVMTRWAKGLKIDLSKLTNLQAFAERVAARPQVQQALKEEGLS